MGEPNKIEHNMVIVHYGKGHVRFQMNLALSLRWDRIFSKAANTFRFNEANGLLNLGCLSGLHVETERFLPQYFFVRPYLQTALKYRLANDDIRTVLGIGKSVFGFLAAIALASTGNHKAVLYLRKVTDDKENGSGSAFWMTKTDDDTVSIVACRNLEQSFSPTDVSQAIVDCYFKGTDNQINKTNSPTSFEIKIIVDGPRYDEDTGQKGSDLITSGGYPVAKQDNMDGVWRFPLNAWSFKEMAPALKAIKNCNREVAKRLFETTGGSIRQALKCLKGDGTVDDVVFQTVRKWMSDISEAHASVQTVEMVYKSTVLSADPDSLDPLRSMIVTEDAGNPTRINRQVFQTCMLLASPYVAKLLHSKLTIDDMLKALTYAKNSGIGSLYGWHFELWAHKISEMAIDAWLEEEKKAIAEGRVEQGSRELGHVEGEGTGKHSVTYLKAAWLYWKPSIPNFANIDAAILLDDGFLLCMQFTVDIVHSFNFKTFKSDFLDQIREGVLSKVASICVLFVTASDEGVFSVRVPHAQANICTALVDTIPGSPPKVHYVRPKETVVNIPTELDGSQEHGKTDEGEEMDTSEDGKTGADDDNSMLTKSIFSDYEEDLDYQYFYDEIGERNLELKQEEWATTTKFAFRWMSVDPARTEEGCSPFFNLPDPQQEDFKNI